MYKKYRICVDDDWFKTYSEDLLKYYTYKYVYILHNKDLTKNHYHIYIECSSSLTKIEVAERLCVPNNFIVEIPFNTNIKTELSYMLKIADNKICQYSKEDLHSNFDLSNYLKGL